MSVLEKTIGWLAPPVCVICTREGSALCVSCAAAEIIPYGEHCWSCGAVSAGGRTCEHCRLPGSPRHVWITTNYEAAAQELVKKYKFGHLRAAADSLTALMVQTFQDFNGHRSFPDYLVVPVPTATSRLRERGFDHSVLLAKLISRQLKLESRDALSRLGQARQLGAKRQVRLSQPADKYLVKFPSAVKGRDILLIDDVVTTGATIRAATKALRAAGARRVDALVLAKRL